jgi:ribonuclease HII
LRRAGFSRIAGVDEVGRGCLFGPVYAAAVILAPERPVKGLQDSKALSAAQREALSHEIREHAAAWAVASISVEEIDRINILQAARKAMKLAVQQLTPAPDYLLVDATTVDLPLPQEGIIRGDQQCAAIAAASIIAKTTRDAYMVELDERFPGYGVAQHKGYGTPTHLRALRELGVCAEHRRSFAPVRAIAEAQAG